MQSVTSNAVAESLSYDTSEQLTGGKWIDGKPIYREVRIATENKTLTPQNWTAIAGWSDLAKDILIDTLISANTGIIDHGTQRTTVMKDPANQNPLRVANLESIYDLHVNIGQWFIIEYTKTTD